MHLNNENKETWRSSMLSGKTKSILIAVNALKDQCNISNISPSGRWITYFIISTNCDFIPTLIILSETVKN